MKTLKFLSIFLLSMIIFANAQETPPPSLLQQGDMAYKNLDNKKALDFYLKVFQNDTTNYEAAWKCSRAFVDVGEKLEGDARAENYKKGKEFAEKAIALNPEGSNGHLFYSVATGRVALDAGAKERIRLSKEIKQHVDLAIKYDPQNDIAYHVLGRWNRKLSNLSWVEKKFANLFLGGVPKEASYENAVFNFKKAIELHPEHINHHLELGITYKEMDNKELAKKEFETCLSLANSDADDPEYKAQAKKYLDDLK
ncbi:MAG: tetratricopeptide repeat protein [Calditrichaceae bacterium]